ncbi:MAG: hypothetical protein ACREUQ_04415, partial [Burkholderiales bacterium]
MSSTPEGARKPARKRSKTKPVGGRQNPSSPNRSQPQPRKTAKQPESPQARLKSLARKLEEKNAELKLIGDRLRETEARSQSTSDALKASRDREKLTLTFAEIGICELDLRTRNVRASEMSQHLMGFPGGQPDIP